MAAPDAVSVSRRFPVCNAKSNFYQWEVLRKLIPRLDNAARYYDSDYERITSAIEYRGSSRDSVTSPCRVSSSGCACGRGAKRSTKIKYTFIYQTLVVNALGKSRADVGIILLDLTSWFRWRLKLGTELIIRNRATLCVRVCVLDAVISHNTNTRTFCTREIVTEIRSRQIFRVGALLSSDLLKVSWASENNAVLANGIFPLIREIYFAK